MLFENVNNKFFNPLCCKNRELYIGCIRQMLEKSKEIPVLYETDARNCLILYLQNCQYAIETEDIGEEINQNRTPQENASLVLRYFRSCGWIMQQEIGRTGDNIASVSAACRKLIDAIVRIFGRESEGTITNHIFSIYEILKSAFEEGSARSIRPYTNILVPLMEDESDLKNELLVLKDSIRIIMRTVMQIGDANSFGQFLIKDELLDRFFNDYFFIKRSGLIPSYVSQIERLLRRLCGSALYVRMTKEYAALKNVSEQAARERIDRQFEELESFISWEYEREIDQIDKKINTYYNLYAVRISMVLSDRTNLEQELNRLLLELKNLDETKRAEVLSEIAKAHRLTSMGFVGRKSFVRRKKANPNLKNAGLPEQPLSEEERRRLTEELLTEFPDRYSIDNVRDYFAGKTTGKQVLSVEDCNVRTREDAMMIASSMIYSGTSGFPYEVEFADGTVQTDVAEISRVIIRRKNEESR